MNVTDDIIVTHVIRVKEETFEGLMKRGKWDETMDTIVSRILQRLSEAEEAASGQDEEKLNPIHSKAKLERHRAGEFRI